jgi:hypothetical protein
VRNYTLKLKHLERSCAVGQGWTEKDIEMILVSPFSSITVAPVLTEEHEPPLSTEAWIEINTKLIHSLGAESWLTRLLSILEGKEDREEQMSPYNVINIDPRFAFEHAPIVPCEIWIEANAKLIPQLGAEQWLRTFLDILEGDILGSSEFGPDLPYGYAPAGYQASSRLLFSRKGKRRSRKKKKK